MLQAAERARGLVEKILTASRRVDPDRKPVALDRLVEEVLALLEATLPELTGNALAMELLRIRPDLPIVLCSGLGETFGTGETTEIGIRARVKKPFTAHEIGLAVRQALDAPPVTTQVQATGP